MKVKRSGDSREKEIRKLCELMQAVMLDNPQLALMDVVYQAVGPADMINITDKGLIRRVKRFWEKQNA